MDRLPGASRLSSLARCGSAVCPTLALAVACLAHVLYQGAASKGEMVGQTAMVALMPLFAVAGLTALAGLALFVPRDQEESSAARMEDGFVIAVDRNDWAALREALLEGRNLTLKLAGEITLLHIQWRRAKRSSALGRGFQATNFVFYQNESIVQERLKGTEVPSAFMKQIELIGEEFFADDTDADGFDIVMVVKPGKVSKAWFVSRTCAVTEDRLAALRKRIEAVPPPEVIGGPLVFAISGTIADGEREKIDPKIFSPPMPREWAAAIQNAVRPLLIPDDIVSYVWPPEH